MLSRRHLRIKVFQAIYGSVKDGSVGPLTSEKNLFSSIDKIYELFILQLSFLVELQKIALVVIEERKSKKLPSREDLNPNLKFANNRVLTVLSNSNILEDYKNSYKVDWNNDIDLVRKTFKSISKSRIYKAYMEANDDDFDNDKAFVVKFFKHLLADNENINHHFDEKNIHWGDDQFFVSGYVVKFLKSLNSSFNENSSLPSQYKDEEDDIEFVKTLFQNTIKEDEELEKIVMKRARNWESDRIAAVDMILMKMAVCELLYLKSIPVKVTLNEYIDISKDYSTPKSKVFINGVLDKLIVDLKDEGKLLKTGRGLIG